MASKELPREVVDWALTNLPIRKDQAAAMAEAERTLTNERMLVALRLHASGLCVTDAAQATGYADHSAVARKARELGFVPPDRVTLGQEFRRLAGMLLDAAIRRAEENPDEIPTSTLQILMGIATDKAAKAEGWETKQGDPSEDKAAAFLERLKQAGVNRISLDRRGETLEVAARTTPNGRRLSGNGAA